MIADNRATIHRGLACDDTKYKRELRRVTTLDLPRPMVASVAVEAQGARLR